MPDRARLWPCTVFPSHVSQDRYQFVPFPECSDFPLAWWNDGGVPFIHMCVPLYFIYNIMCCFDGDLFDKKLRYNLCTKWVTKKYICSRGWSSGKDISIKWEVSNWPSKITLKVLAGSGQRNTGGRKCFSKWIIRPQDHRLREFDDGEKVQWSDLWSSNQVIDVSSLCAYTRDKYVMNGKWYYTMQKFCTKKARC